MKHRTQKEFKEKYGKPMLVDYLEKELAKKVETSKLKSFLITQNYNLIIIEVEYWFFQVKLFVYFRRPQYL